MKTAVLGAALAALASIAGQAPSRAVAEGAPRFEVIDQAAFDRLFAPDAAVRKLASGFKFAEGPVWMGGPGAGGYLVFSDVPANEMKRWDAAEGVRTLRAPSGSANGNTRDRDGRLLTAEHAGRISRTEANGTVVTLVDAFDGKRLNSPNDVIVSRDGSVWFTDPAYGLAGRKQETPGNYVYRLNPATKILTPVVTDLGDPNGLCLSPDEHTLYVANSAKPPVVRAYAVNATTPFTGREFAAIDKGVPDGIRCDALGNVWSSAGDGVQIFDASGARVGRILLPETAANLAFGGPDGRTVFITASSSLYAVERLLR